MDPFLQVKSFLENNRMASIATVSGRAKDPHISVIYYFYENGILYFATERNSGKAKNILRNKKLSIAIVQEKQLELLQIEGTGAILIEKEERVKIIQKIYNKLSKDDVHDIWPVLKLHPNNIEVFEVTIERFTYSNFAEHTTILEGHGRDLHESMRTQDTLHTQKRSAHRPRFFPHLKRR